MNRIILIFIFVSGCVTHDFSTQQRTDKEIESLLTGNWFVSPIDTYFYTKPGNAISSYTLGHEVFFIQYADADCELALLEAKAVWKVEQNKLFITVVGSTAPKLIPVGFTTTDEILYIDENSMALRAIGNDHTQLRTKTDTCKVRHL
ncbi:MAG: hypothetical protein HYZ31_01735 [Gammaproteobacteria bacterium]|nr:hypothetical protein [Gammaproteobacteria bacterium]